ncbi:YDG domain-containing protein [Sphingomonas sp. KR1UV-12]|uniref:YDG domain-containing protein n=1 Tax=Sphingomonas aurea TaxID=3063994 RepID=A0ABT9EHP9_9SPHN|nr:YDG domain-containing protein [Sphingomonas sp. KR1UV-12]MDP1026489.1 YDG domain-containing protein [Sphingomonas sp. KR1UV-12]
MTFSHAPRRRLLVGASSVALLGTLALSTPLRAQTAPVLPTGGSVVSGSATITTGANRVDIHQTSDRMVANWTGFDIGAGGAVVFQQPGANSVALNRVTGGSASQILGRLSANGQVWLLNPNGVVFGRGASVDVGGLVASSLALSDADFAAGRLRLTGGTGAGAIVNGGVLGSAAGGVVALVGPSVTNSGTITTPGGSTVLAAGDAVTLDFVGDGLVGYRVERGVLGALAGNSGTIDASGGLVALTARGADAATASVVNNSGLIRATALVSRAGRIVLDGDATAGAVDLTGTLDASSAFGRGGAITVTGHDVALSGAAIDASGTAGGGIVQIGGGRFGKDAGVANATNLTVDAASTIRADATTNGNGGEVTAWSDRTTRFAGRLSARGGAAGGDGGQLEVSGKEVLHYAGIADALAPMGRTGDLLLDPTNITIEGGSGTSGDWTSGTGDITVYAATLEAQTANVLLQATRYITFNDLNGNGGDGDIVMQRNVSFRAETLNGLSGTPSSRRASILFANPDNTLKVSGTGSIYMNGGGLGEGSIGERIGENSTQSPGIVTGRLGTFNLIAGDPGDVGDNPAIGSLPSHDVGVIGNGTPGAGSITLLGADGITVSGNITTHGGYVRISGDSDNGGNGSITLNKNISTEGGNLYVYFGRSPSSETNVATIGGNVTLGTGRLVFGDEVKTANPSAPNLGDSTGIKRLSGLLDLSGNVNFSTPLTMLGGANIRTDGNINFTSTVNFNTGSQSLTLRATNISFAGATLQNSSTANIILEPHDPTTNINLDGNDGIVPSSSFTQLAGVRNLTIGRLDGTGTTTISSSGFAFGATERLTLLNGAIQVDGLLRNTSGTGSVLARAGSTDVTIGSGGAISAPGSGTAVIAAAARNFVNLAGSGALVASGGRWLTYSTDPTADTRGGLTIDFKQYAATYGLTAPAQASGNGHLYTVAPIVGVALTGTTTKVYDGTTAATLALSNFATSGGIDGDDVSQIMAGYTSAAYADRNVGTGKGVTASGLTLGTAQNGAVTVYGYGVGANATGLIGTITPRTVTAQAVAQNRAYDGTVTATATPGFAAGAVIAGDALNVSASGATFADANAGFGKTVTVSGLMLSGTDAANYQLATSTATTTATITRRIVSAILGAQDKVYDGTTAATVAAGFGNGAVIGNDSLAVSGTGTFDTRNVGIGKTVTVSGLTLTGADAGNYQLSATTGTTTAAITQRIISAQFSAQNKVYDGTTAATVGIDFANGGLIAGDSVSATGTGTFDTRNAGTGKTVTVSGLTLSGADAGNYQLSTTAGTTTAAITQRIISALLSAQNKVYDGTTVATIGVDFANGALIAGDSVSATGTGVFDTRDAGTGKTVTVSGVTLTGADAGNYQLSTATGTTTAAITRRIISALLSAQNKVYDGTTVATIGVDFASGALIAGDSVSATGTGVFDTRNAGTGKTVTVSGVTLTGADAGNYQLSATAGTTTAAITQRIISALLSAQNKVYDGTTAAVVGAAFANGVLVAGDSVNVAGTGSFDTRNAGTGKTVTVNGLALSGTDAGNYRLAATTGTTSATIAPRLVTALVTANDKTFDGTVLATLAGSRFDGLIAGDKLTATGSARFDTAAAGLGKVVTVSGLTLTGADSGNYRLASTSAATSADILPRADAATLLAGIVGSPQGANGTAQEAGGTAVAAAAVIGDARRDAGATLVTALPAPSGAAGLVFGNHVVSAAGRTSLLLDEPATAAIRGEPMSIYRSATGTPLNLIGTYVATDGGNTVALQASASGALPPPALRAPVTAVQASAETPAGLLDLSVGEIAPGVLMITVIRDPGDTDAETVALYGLATAKTKLALSVAQIRTVVVSRGAAR